MLITDRPAEGRCLHVLAFLRRALDRQEARRPLTQLPTINSQQATETFIHLNVLVKTHVSILIQNHMNAISSQFNKRGFALNSPFNLRRVVAKRAHT